MTREEVRKICPILSLRMIVFSGEYIECQKDKCQLWDKCKTDNMAVETSQHIAGTELKTEHWHSKTGHWHSKTGHWEPSCADIPNRCSVCGEDWDKYVYGPEVWYTGELPKFCPNCGVRIGGVENDNNRREKENCD